jgi:2-oxoisovalerate dehydrogenase E1 component alpha subunit
MDGTDKVLMTCYGEGSGRKATRTRLSTSAIHKVPEIFVCENNGFAISTSFQQGTPSSMAQRAAGYGFPGVTLDGRDPVTAYRCQEAIARARAGEADLDRMPRRPAGAHLVRDDQRGIEHRKRSTAWRFRTA